MAGLAFSADYFSNAALRVCLDTTQMPNEELGEIVGKVMRDPEP